MSKPIYGNTVGGVSNKQDITNVKSDVKNNRYRIQDLEKHVGIGTPTFQSVEIKNSTPVAVPEKSMKWAAVTKIEGHIITYYHHGSSNYTFVRNYPKTFESPDGTVMGTFGPFTYGEDDFGVEGNYLYINEDGKVRYHQSRKIVDGNYELAEGESVYMEFWTDNVTDAKIINLATPIDSYTPRGERDDPYIIKIDTSKGDSITMVPKFTEADIEAMEETESIDWHCGDATVVFELV